MPMLVPILHCQSSPDSNQLQCLRLCQYSCLTVPTVCVHSILYSEAALDFLLLLPCSSLVLMSTYKHPGIYLIQTRKQASKQASKQTSPPFDLQSESAPVLSYRCCKNYHLCFKIYFRVKYLENKMTGSSGNVCLTHLWKIVWHWRLSYNTFSTCLGN